MKILRLIKQISVFLSASILLLGMAASSHADIAEIEMNSDAVVFHPTGKYAGFNLTVVGPEGFYLNEDFSGNTRPNFDIRNESHLPDGLYKFELVAVPNLPRGDRVDNASPSDNDDASKALTGNFRINNGSILVNSSLSNGDTDEVSFTKDQVILDDLIANVSLCVGQDCVNGESFGFDTIRLKENNLRIHFNDTSNSASFPSNDWRIVANDTSNGGANYLGIEDSSAGRIPFRVEAGAPANSLYVEDGGRIGLGTSTPVVELHVVNGDSPTLRLEQNGSSGFTPQTWDLVSNEVNFFIRDATNGSQLPFRIRPSAPTSSIDIASNGDIGMGTASPAASLHVRRTDGSGVIQIEDTQNTASEKFMLKIINGGTGKTRFQIGNSDVTWSIDAESTGSGFFNVSKFGTGTNEFRVDGDGNGTFLGDVTANGVLLTSSRRLKTEIESVDSEELLKNLAELEVSHWQFIDDEEEMRHIGPMAEDFQRLFGGSDNTHINLIDANGVLFAAVKGLYELTQDKQQRITELEQKNHLLETESRQQKKINKNLEQRINALEKLFSKKIIAVQ